MLFPPLAVVNVSMKILVLTFFADIYFHFSWVYLEVDSLGQR